VGNTGVLKETALVEAFNLKAAIEYMMKNNEAAKDALDDMPPRDESELDVVTLHSQALMEMDEKPTEGFRKLNFLLHQHPSPPETFVNFCCFIASMVITTSPRISSRRIQTLLTSA